MFSASALVLQEIPPILVGFFQLWKMNFVEFNMLNRLRSLPAIWLFNYVSIRPSPVWARYSTAFSVSDSIRSRRATIPRTSDHIQYEHHLDGFKPPTDVNQLSDDKLIRPVIVPTSFFVPLPFPSVPFFIFLFCFYKLIFYAYIFIIWLGCLMLFWSERLMTAMAEDSNLENNQIHYSYRIFRSHSIFLLGWQSQHCFHSLFVVVVVLLLFVAGRHLLLPRVLAFPWRRRRTRKWNRTASPGSQRTTGNETPKRRLFGFFILGARRQSADLPSSQSASWVRNRPK